MTYDKWLLVAGLLDNSKSWFWAHLAVKMLAAIFGLVAYFANLPSGVAAFVGFCIVCLSEIIGWRSDYKKALATGLRDKLDFEDAIGWNIRDYEMRDTLASAPKGVLRRASAQTARNPYFDSKQPIGARRVLENVEESAWWSKTLAEQMHNFCLILSIAAVGCATLVMLAALTAPQNPQGTKSPRINEGVARFSMAVFGAIPSIGLLKLMQGFHAFHKKAKSSEQDARILLESAAPNESEAIKLLLQYQAARAVAPPLPTMFYRMRRDHLNQCWTSYKGEHRRS